MIKVKTFVIFSLLVLVMVGVVLAAQFPVIVVDDRGKEIVIQKEPERIVVAGLPLYSEILFDIGAGDRIVGITESPNNPPAAEGIPKVGSVDNPNISEILNLEPDLVLGIYGEPRDRLEGYGITVLLPGKEGGYITDLTGLLDVVKIIGRAVGKTESTNKLLTDLALEVIEVEDRVLGEPRPKVAFVYFYSGSPPYASGSGSVGDELIYRAGGTNVFSGLGAMKQVNYEEIIAKNPQYIFTDPSMIEAVKDNKFLKNLEAVKKDRIYGIKASSLTSTRVTEALRKMAKALHPEAFSE